MNVVLGMALLLLIAVFSIITSKEKGNRRKKGARWIHRWSRKKGWELPEWLTDKCIWQTELAALAAGMLLVVTGMVGHAENMQAVSELRRPAYGQGVQEENLQVEWKDEQGKRQKEEMTVQVTEKQFSESEIEEIFSGLRDRIENEMLGENDSLDHVDHPLHLCEELPDCPVTIRWFSSRPEIMDWEGTYGEMIGEKGEEVILTATTTPDHHFPTTSSIIAYHTGCKNAMTFDLQGACAGFLYALETGSNYIRSGRYKKVVVVAGDKMTAITDYQDRSTCPLFGDACGAVLLEPTTEEVGVMDTILRTDGVGYSHLIMKSGGSAYPPSHDTVDNREHFVFQDGKYVFKYAVSYMADVAAEIAERNGLTHDDIAWIVPHQANLRIIDATAKRLGVDMEKVMINIQKYGNTSAGTIPICLWEWEDKLKKGDNLILAAFGAGFTWGAIYLKWGYNGKQA